MSQPVTPKFFADTVVCGRITINYKPEWDGTAWQIIPANVRVLGIGNLTEGGDEVTQAEIDLQATDLPAAGVAALQDLLQFIETKLANKYS